MIVLISLVPLLHADRAGAHGLWGHIHVTGWAIENLPSGELRDFFADPEVVSAALYGSAFPDSGFWVNDARHREYAEYTHWEPFVQGFIEHIRAEYPPPFNSLQQRRLIAFLMGCAAHGLQDEIFDSLFLFEVEQRDESDQGVADGGTDYFLYDDGHFRFSVEEYVPMETLLELYADIPQPISADIVRQGVDAQLSIYLNPTGIESFSNLFLEGSRAQLPWTGENYLEASVPGSLVAEITPTMAYWQAIWERLHHRWDERNLVIHSYPEKPRRLRTHRSDSAASWTALVLGRGAAETTGQMYDRDGTLVDALFTGTRWGHPFPRIVRFLPGSDLVPGAVYNTRLMAGAKLIGGGVTEHTTDISFQVECTDDSDSACDELGEIAAPVIDGSFVPVTGTQSSSGCSVSARGTRGAVILLILPFLLLVRRKSWKS